MEFTRIDNDTYGNPRYVVHYLALASTYEEALKIAKGQGGRKFHNKKYGGGIVFSTYNVDILEKWLMAEITIRKFNQLGLGYTISGCYRHTKIDGMAAARALDHLFSLAIETDEDLYKDVCKLLCADKLQDEYIKAIVGSYRYNKVIKGIHD